MQLKLFTHSFRNTFLTSLGLLIYMFDNISSTAHSTVNIGHPITIECIYLDLDHILCNGTEYEQLEEKLSPSDSLFWIYLGIYIVLVLFAGKRR